jgi:hypothetical protein
MDVVGRHPKAAKRSYIRHHIIQAVLDWRERFCDQLRMRPTNLPSLSAISRTEMPIPLPRLMQPSKRLFEHSQQGFGEIINVDVIPCVLVGVLKVTRCPWRSFSVREVQSRDGCSPDRKDKKPSPKPR